MVFVVDASVVAKLAVQEPETAAVTAWFDQTAHEVRLAPQLLWSEVGRAIQKNRGKATRGQLAAIHERVVGLVDLQPPSAPHVWAHADALTLHDAQYLALALATKATIVTCDKVLAQAARKARVPVVTF